MADEQINIVEEAEQTSGANAAENSAHTIDDLVVDTSPGFAMGSLMIGASQSQTRAMEAGVIALNQHYTVGLATTAQSVSKLLGMQSEQLQEFMASLQAAQNR